MTEENPLSGNVQGNDAANSAAENDNDSILAALSALSDAAAPASRPTATSDMQAESTGAESEDAPAVETAVVDVTEIAEVADTPSAEAASAEAVTVVEPALPTDPAAPDPATRQEVAPPPPPAPDAAEAYPAPTGAPVAVAAPAAVAPPPPTKQRKRWPWILAICIVAGVVLIGGVVACTSAMLNTAFHAVQHNERHLDHGDLYNRDSADGILNYYFSGMDVTFDELLTLFGVKAGDTSAEVAGSYMRGAYRVGGEDGIEPGLYYLEGSQSQLSNFYLFDGEDEVPTTQSLYELEVSVEYFGNYYTYLEPGDAIIFIPGTPECTMHIAQQPMDVTPPYESGCYRVGIDIPAGTYTITCQTETARATTSEAGAYIMKDLEFNEDSILESAYVIKGGRQTITVKDGEYLELFAAIATPATASTRTPLQPAGSEATHGA